MQTSIVIPTYNRVKDVDECMESIVTQTVLPKEVIIVDDSDNTKIKDLTKHKNDRFYEANIALRYIKNKKEKSLTIARNVGIENSTGDIILFLDDDVILDEKYLEEILLVYEKYPKALGVQGHITNINSSELKNIIKKLFFYSHNERDKCRLLPSTNTTYPYTLTKIITCQWLSGSNQSYKRSVLENFKFDENLKRYSYKEDVDLSYRIYKQNPGSLYITPHAELIHKVSQEIRLPNKILTYMQQTYTFYFFYKNIDQNTKNKLIFIWGRVGGLIVKIGESILSHSEGGFLKFKYLIEAYIFCARNIRDIKEGDLEFFNASLR